MSVTVQGITEEPPEPIYSPCVVALEPKIRPQHPIQGNIVMRNASSFVGKPKAEKFEIIKALL